MKIVDDIFAWIGKKLHVSYSGKWDFEVFGDVLVIHVAVGNLPPLKAEEYIKTHANKFSNLKESFKVKEIIWLPKR